MADTTRLAGAVSSPHRAGAAPVGPAPERQTRIHAALERIANPERVYPVTVGAGIAAWLAFAAVAKLVPNTVDLPMAAEGSIDETTGFVVVVALAIAAAWAAVWALGTARGPARAWAVRHLTHDAKWVLGAGIWLLFWEFSTAKTSLLAPPYFDAPQQILTSLWQERGILAESLGASLLLLAVGFAVGLIAGLITGVTIGWFQAANYWVHPILIFIGPVPSLAWVPIVFVLFPSTYAGAVFMIALSVWFPITVLTRAGILSVPRSYYDVAQTLGARGWFLVARVSLPAALPSIFTGAFMALSAAFVSLTVAENFGVNAGLGWYLTYMKGFGNYPGLYAGIVVLVVVCGAALTLLFRVRNYVLRWEKELTRW
ncbi:ABC transporter permease [Gryllotalpicola koreensis]|uniref:ABC transmembrane type-1 domain-containing protein n=1 Tax=Gryllotalpicola koreensis TaxID=993086 RepID=A0ABP8A5Z8_9MICO